MTTRESSFPTNRAFVVQFRVQPEGGPPGYEGRMEHLVSGCAPCTSPQAPRSVASSAQRLTSVAEKPPWTALRR